MDRSDIPTYAHYLRMAGYYTALSGKMHFVGPDQLHGFEERLTTDIYPADFGWTPNYHKPEERIDWWYHNLSSVTGKFERPSSVEASNLIAHQHCCRLRGDVILISVHGTAHLKMEPEWKRLQLQKRTATENLGRPFQS